MTTIVGAVIELDEYLRRHEGATFELTFVGDGYTGTIRDELGALVVAGKGVYSGEVFCGMGKDLKSLASREYKKV